MNAKNLAVIALVLASTASAQGKGAKQTNGPIAIVPDAMATRAERAPVIDGSDADEAWRAATVTSDFRVFDPTEGAEPRFRTEARITYDAMNIYVLVRAFDPHPDSIITLLSRRDTKTTSDQIKVMIDSYHDRRTGYEFAVNPAGVKRDYYTYDDGNEDISWDAVWDVATRTDSLGWIAEFRIPVSQLRYAPAAEHRFGVMIMRDVPRFNERYSWPLYKRSQSGLASQFAPVGGFVGLGSPTRLEVSPYALTKNTSAFRTTRFDRVQQQAIGADIKYGITSNLTLDAAVNPDFGQVEADPATLNLTAFETFFSERRPFFLEGTGIFRFGDSPETIFYSRRIGRAPQLGGLVSDPNADVPGASRILGAAKLTGRLGGGTSIGVLGAATEQVSVGSTTIEPATGYALARASRDFAGGESALGFIATATHRSLDATTETYLRSDAYTAGIDARSRFADGKYSVKASAALSDVRGTRSAITRTQRNSVHQYQRPDDALVVDTLATSLSGMALAASANKVSGLVRGGLEYRYTSPGYETNDLGFLSRADAHSIFGIVSLVPKAPVGGWRNARLELIANDQLTVAGLRNSSLIEVYASGARANGATASVDAWVDNAAPTYCDRCARGGPALRLSPSYSVLVNLNADPKLRLSPYVAAIYTVADEGRSKLWRVRPYMIFKPSSRINAELGTRFQRNRDNTQYLATVGSVGADSTHYLFAHLDQDLLSFTSRFDFTLRPNLSLQMYAEPFISAGHYTNVRELAAPRASDYDARFRAYAKPAPNGDFNEKSFNASAVVRWEYRPASTLFLVWTQSRGQFDEDRGNFAASRDYKNLFAARPDNVFLVKASYWLGR